MEEFEVIKAQLLHYLRCVWKNRWIGIGIASVVFIAGVMVVDRVENQYRAETRVYIDSTSILRPLLSGLAIQTDFNEIVRLMIKQLLSRPNLERAARLMDMGLDTSDEAQTERLIKEVRDKVDVSVERRTGIYTISYIDEDRLKAKRMVQTLLDIFVEDSLGRTDDDSESAVRFLEQQIAKYDKLLREAEQRREDFKRKNIGLMPRDGATYYSQLKEVERQIEASELALSELENRRVGLEGQLSTLQRNEPSSESVVKTDLDRRIEQQEKQLDELLILYTERHPDVVSATQTLNMLREKKEQEKKETVTSESIRENPVYQQLQIMASRARADISSTRARIQSLNAKKRELAKLVDIVPQIESEMQRLNRDYDVYQQNYSRFVAQREKALISEDAEAGTEQVKFQIIEPPYVSLKPSWPNRQLYDLAILLFSLGLGYGTALLVALVQPVFYRPLDLQQTIARAVLGAINKFDTPNVVAKRRKDIVFFGLANIVFLLSAGLIILLHSEDVVLTGWLQSRIISL